MNLSVFLSLTSKNALSYYAYVFSSTKLEIRASSWKQVGRGEKGGDEGPVGRNNPNNVCTCE
jgi:hypothetical protein